MTIRGTEPNPRDRDLLRATACRLADRSTRPVPVAVIEAMLEEAYDTLRSSSTIASYLPLLAERAVADRLRARPERGAARGPCGPD